MNILIAVVLLIIGFLAGWFIGNGRRKDGELTVSGSPDTGFELSNLTIETNISDLINKKHMNVRVVRKLKEDS